MLPLHSSRSENKTILPDEAHSINFADSNLPARGYNKSKNKKARKKVFVPDSVPRALVQVSYALLAFDDKDSRYT